MKITKNMYVNNTAESRELELYMENTRDLYFRCIIPAINNLKKKMARGVFDKEKATILFYHVATKASEAYNRDFGYKFTVTERWTAASNVLEQWLDDIMEED